MLVLIAVVKLFAGRAVDVVVPVADEEALIEERPVRTEEGESLTSEVRVCTHPEHLTSRLDVRIIACGDSGQCNATEAGRQWMDGE